MKIDNKFTHQPGSLPKLTRRASHRPLRLLAAIVASLLALIGTGVWLQAEYTPVEPIKLAQEFVDLIHTKQFAKAHQLTMKNSFVGTTPEALEEISQRQMCAVTRMVRAFPFQSNGNRLRRWASGAEVEMPEVNVEFDGGCLLSVRVRRVGAGDWKIFYFATHAG